MDSFQSMASSFSSTGASLKRTSQFSSQTQAEMEFAKARHHSELDYPTTASEWSAEFNSKYFALLKEDPQWGRFFKDFESLEVGEEIGAGAQADIYEARITRDGPFDLVVKVMKGDTPLQALQAQWPIGMLSARSKYKHLFDLPLITILGGTMLRDERLRGRFAFVMCRRWGDLRVLIDRRMKQERSTPGPFPLDEAIHLMLSIAEDMDTLHTKHNIIHRNLKASNVLVREEFGEDLSPIALPNRVARTGAVVADFECSLGVLGTGGWRAPEILRQVNFGVPSSEVHFTRASDVYSYGMTCYEIVTGCIPYDGIVGADTISQILQGRRPELPHELPEFLTNIIVGCWHSDPSERPSFSAICTALKLKRGPNPVSVVVNNKSQRGAIIVKDLPGLANNTSITNEIRGEDRIEADIFHTDKRKSEVQLESKDSRNAGKPTSIGDYLPIDLTRDLLGASSRGYVIRIVCPHGQGGWYPCALKRIDTMDESEPDLARLCHPHVVQLFHHWKKKIDYGEVREMMPKSAFMTFLMMELMDGDLGNLMTSIKTTGLSPFSLLVAVHIMLQIAEGMLYLHEMGVSHPHLKCNNVLCRVKSTAQIPFRVGDVLVKLGGFGCSRAANDDTKNRDVFCFGLTCLEILTGDECVEDIYGADKVSRPSIPETTPCILKDCIASCLDTKITFSEAITLLLLAQNQIIQTCEDKRILCSVNLHIKSPLSNNQDLASSSTSKIDCQEMFHVHQLHPQLGEVATSVQITLIFFHGFPKVLEEWRMTWLTRDNRLVWPQMWLPEDLDGDIRVLSVSFDDRPNVSSIQSIKDLLQILVISATCKLGETDQAIVLVGHSFGGVIIKALVAAAQGLAGKTVENNAEIEEVLKCKNFLKRLASIVFYSVPHAFTNMEFENYISGCGNTRVLQRSCLLKDLRKDSVFISDMIQLSRDFENAVPRKTKLLAFLEGKPMSKKSLLVTENSGEGLLLSWEWHKIDRDNHFEVCRPVSKSHIGYKVLLNHLQQHMFPPSAVNVRRIWKVISTVLICICKFKEVLSRYRMVKCFSAEDTIARGLEMRHRACSLGSQVPICQAEGCKADLSTVKAYHRRHTVCEPHSKALTVLVGGHKQRFCQQCSRFHHLGEFDEGKRSCRKRLANHHRRRRKPQPNASISGGTPAESIGIKPGEDGDHSGVDRTNDPKSMVNMHFQKNCASPSPVFLEDSDEKPGTPGVGNLQLRPVWNWESLPQHIKALGTTSDPSTSHQHQHEDFDFWVLNSALEDAEKVIMHWDMGRWILESTEEDARTYLNAVDEILTELESMKTHNRDPKLLEEAQHLLQLAMKRLEGELRHVLEWYTGFVVPGVLIDSFSANSFRDEEEDEEDEEDGDEEKFQVRKLERTQSKALALLPAIVTRLIAGGFKKECVQVYTSSRKIVLERSLEALGVERMSIEVVQKMPWELQVEKIRIWNQAMKVAVSVLFAREKQLCDQVFTPPLADICFNDYANSEMLHLLSFGDAIALSRRSPEKLFKVLDMYDTLRFLIPDLELTFSGTSGTSVRSSASDVLSHLAEAVRATFVEFEHTIQHDSSRVPVTDGSVHPLTSYVMSYIQFACDYTDTLKLVYGETTQSLAVTLASPPRYHHSHSPDDKYTREEASSLANQISRVAQVLQANLEGKAKLYYKDPALAHIFLMNNIHYMVQKVKSSEGLLSFLDDIWVRRQAGMIRKAAASYYEVAWTKVMACLTDVEGLHNQVSRQVLKDKFKNFNTIFDEVHQTQSPWVVLDPMLRDELQTFIADKVLPAYRVFLGRYGQYIETGRLPDNYAVEDLEMAIGELFTGSPGSSRRPFSLHSKQ